MLVDSVSQNGTILSVRVMNEARGTKGGEVNPEITFGSKYHSCWGYDTKSNQIQAYTDQKFPVMFFTSALVLGQILTHTRIVIQLGRSGVPEVTQVVGQVGQPPNYNGTL